jgi:hypothetical protein
MGRSSAQSDFVFQQEPEVFDQPVVLPPGADPIHLPKPPALEHGANPTATRVVMTVMFVLFALLAILTLVGPHIPSGE